MSTSLRQTTIFEHSATSLSNNPSPSPTPSAPVHGRPTATTQARNAHNRTGHQPVSPLFILPSELLLKMLTNLDQPALESLRRTSRVFLRALPNIYPRLFTRTLQGTHPWPVRRLWTLGAKQREELGRLLARDHDPSVVDGKTAVGAVAVDLSRGKGEGVKVGCGGGMLGLAKAWRYIPCADCGRIHPPSGVMAPLLGPLKE